MNDHTEELARASARERMFDVDLSAVFDDERTALSQSANSKPRSVMTPLLAAAIALLGLTVTVLVGWQQNQPMVPAQDPVAPPAVMPVCRWITKPRDFANTPLDSQNVAVYSMALDDYGQVAAFQDLRRLMVLGPGLPDPTAKTLLPLSKLKKLEELEIPVSADLQPEHLHALAKAATVRSLRLHLKRAITPKDVRALKLMPQLRVLILHGGQLDAATVRSFSELPHLDELILQSIAGCSEEALVQLRVVHRLRRLTLTSIGEQPLATQLSETPLPGAGLTAAFARVLGDLPLLHELKLITCRIEEEAIAALPDDLRSVYIVRCPDLVSNDLLALKHCNKLTKLGLDAHDVSRWHGAIPQEFLAQPENTGAAQAELIRSLPLTHLDYTGAMPTAVRLAVASKPTMTHVDLEWYAPADLETMATLTNLQTLTLRDTKSIKLPDLKVLAQCSSLQTLTVMYHNWQPAEMQKLLPGVKLIADWR